MVIWVVNWAGGCWGLQVQKLLLASLSHRCTYLHNRSCGPCSFVQWTYAHLLKHGVKCRLCWQVGMGVCRRGAGPNAGSTFIHTSRTPETGREAQAIPAVQVTSGCLQSFRWTPPPLPVHLCPCGACSHAVAGLCSVLVPGRAEEPRTLDCWTCLEPAVTLGLQPQLHLPVPVVQVNGSSVGTMLTTAGFPGCFPRLRCWLCLSPGQESQGAPAVPTLAVCYSRLSLLT